MTQPLPLRFPSSWPGVAQTATPCPQRGRAGFPTEISTPCLLHSGVWTVRLLPHGPQWRGGGAWRPQPALPSPQLPVGHPHRYPGLGQGWEYGRVVGIVVIAGQLRGKRPCKPGSGWHPAVLCWSRALLYHSTASSWWPGPRGGASETTPTPAAPAPPPWGAAFLLFASTCFSHYKHTAFHCRKLRAHKEIII